MFKSAPTARNNIGYSTISQKLADAQAVAMDSNNCNNCYNCNSCNYCNNCNHCDSCNSCNYCDNCYNCNHCNSCNYCYNCNHCNHCNHCDNCPAQPILQIQGLRWKIYATDTELIIGCERHIFERWKGFSDFRIFIMDPDALEFWGSYKDLIFGMLERAQAAQAAKNLTQSEE